MKILLVCEGNICRSPMAEGIFRQKLAGTHDVASAGLNAPTGRPADPFAVQVCAEHGIDISRHRATPLDGEILRATDLVLAMEASHVRRIVAAHPWTSGRIWRLGHPLDHDYPDLLGLALQSFQAFHSSVLEAFAAWEPQLRT